MSNTNDYCISVKDYAEQRKKTVQAVYQQMKRKENSAQLDGHVFTRRIGNRDVKFLDEEAVLILDKASSSAPVVMVQDDLQNALVAAEQEAENWKAQALMQKGQIALLKEQLREKDVQLLKLAAPQEQIDRLTSDRDAWKSKAEDTSAELAEAKQKIEELESRTLADYLKGWFRKKERK